MRSKTLVIFILGENKHFKNHIQVEEREIVKLQHDKHLNVFFIFQKRTTSYE